jgi:hypothetical protein
MAITLLATLCGLQANNSYVRQDVSYDPAQRAMQQTPITSTTTTAITCTPYQIANNVQLDSYCAVDSMGAGVRRKVFTDTTNSSGVVQPFKFVDSQDGACNGNCDLTSQYQSASPTTAPGAQDGTISVSAYSSHPPVTAFLAGVGMPTHVYEYNAPLLPREYQFVWKNLKPGTYVAQLQDNGNCTLNSNPLTVIGGAAPGTGGLPGNILWFKYEYVLPAPSSVFQINQGKIGGYAWNPITKQGYQVAPITLTFPIFYEFYPEYLIGKIVGYVRDNETIIRYYRALKDMKANMFINNSSKLPYPDEDGLKNGWWERLHDGVHDNVQPLDITYFDPSPRLNNGIFYRNYVQYQVVRYGFNGFYEAKFDLKGFDYRVTGFPKPKHQQDTNEWKYLPGYSFFHYVVPETQIVDQYPLGNKVRRVRFHLDEPDFVDVPSTTDYYPVPGTSTDFILFDDSTPDVETQLGDLKVIDVIKNDIDNAGAENGSVWIIAQSPSLPIKYHLRNGVRPGYVQDNFTGIFEDLTPGAYVVDITDSFQPTNRYVSAEFEIEDKYQPRWKLTYDDYHRVGLETFIYEHDWTGGVTDVCATGEPTILSWDSGGDPGGYLPEAVGSTLEFNLLTSVAQQFVDTVKYDDRKHRVDHYRNGKLKFRGYIDATTYQEKMLGAGQTVTITAADGLGKLKTTKFFNHLLERQTARTNQLSIILKCLSYCDVNLPLHVGLNLRERLMAATADPLAEAYVHRNAYEKKDGKVISDEDIIDCRTVLDSILRNYNAMLFQTDGCWKIISLSEVFDPTFAVRAYSPAGTLLTGVDTSAEPLRILESKLATGARELFWINAVQDRTTIPAAQIVKATVGLQFQTNLFKNGDFVLWNLDTPTYWSAVGAPGVTREQGEKAGEFAVKFGGYTNKFEPAKYLLSPPAPHLTGLDEDYMEVKFRAIVDPATSNPAEATVKMYFQILSDGLPYGNPVEADLTSKDKWKDYTFQVPFGVLTGKTVRVRVLAPQNTSGTATSTVRINSLAITVQPGLVNWTAQKTDYVYAQNNVTTRIGLADVELVHADLPLLPGFNNTKHPAKAMDVFAWRHAVSYADYTPTLEWKRPAEVNWFPLLDIAAQDRLVMREYPATQISGDVSGPGIEFLRQGLMLDMPQDVDGKFLIISCFKHERAATATITVRKLQDGFYGNVSQIPNHVRLAYNPGKGYRISFKNGKFSYRISTP